MKKMKKLKAYQIAGFFSGLLLFISACASDSGAELRVCAGLLLVSVLLGLIAWHLFCKAVLDKQARELVMRRKYVGKRKAPTGCSRPG